MRNLRIVRYEEYPLEDHLPLTTTAWSPRNDTLICAFGPTPVDQIIALKQRSYPNNTSSDQRHYNGPGYRLTASWEAPCPLPELECDEVLLMHYFSDSGTTCVVLAGGDLILVRETPTAGQEAIEIVGSIDDGIAAAAWAPDEEVLAIVTRTDNLILMSQSLEPLNEVAMTENDLQASKHVSVGWGKKETQFQGKRAKAMRDPTMPEHVDEGKLSPFEDYLVSMSWRGDGAYVAVNSVVPNSRRVIRVFSREGVLDSVSEPVDGLESALSWRPAGNLIASLQRHTTGANRSSLEVVFFERNGLRHGQFNLRLSEPHVSSQARKVDLKWNIDSSVLAVCLTDSVQFWTMGNYHYYLKQEIKMTSNTQQIPIRISWHPEHPLTCSVACREKLVVLSAEAQVCSGSATPPWDSGIVAVIDGRTLKLTPLRQAGVPPPMAFCEIETPANINDCAISHNGLLIAVVDLKFLRVFRWKTVPVVQSSQTHPRFTTEHEQIFAKEISNIFDGSRQCIKLCFQSGEATADDILYLLSPAQGGHVAQCYKVNLNTQPLSFDSVTLPPSAQFLQSDGRQLTVWASDGQATTMIGSPDNHMEQAPASFQIEATNGLIFHLSDANPSATGFTDSETYHQVTLKSGILAVDGRAVTRDCTSFIVTGAHLIFTTASHYLKFVHLTLPEKMEIPEDAPEIDERCRAIERGARIVTVMPSIYAVVLQMPRGNIETIYPRVLVLAGIRNSLEQSDYLTAFLACQVQQVDMNILYDHLPNTLLANIPKFVDDLRKPGRIDEFLSKLKDEDVTETLYKDTLKASENEPPSEKPSGDVKTHEHASTLPKQSKVNLICDKFISVLNTRGPKYLTNVVTAHVCKRPPDLTAALMLVSSLKRNSPDEADTAVSHLCFLTDTNRLYDAALGLYDLELTLLVAQNAQRDPREYMPFLQSLQTLPVLRRQYEIDNHLKQYQKALVSLHSLNAHEEVEAYTAKHTLYTTALDLYRYDQEHLRKITILYSEYLEGKSNYASAATLRESLGQYDLAYPLYALAHLWRESLTCATLLPLEKPKLIDLATSLATTCAEESRDYRSAAAIQTDYLDNVVGAARLLCKGSYFAEATRLLALRNLSNEISSIIDPGLTEKFGEIVELIADCKSQLAAQVPRILELRVKKEEDPLAFYGGDANANAADDIPDNISLAPTDATTLGGQSLFTRYGNASKFGGTVASNVSRKTSKTKRREERKRARGKKGSVYEEEYLIASVGRLIDRVNGVQDEVKRLTSGLLRRGLRDQSAKVDEIMIEICILCEKARAEIWLGPVQPENNMQDSEQVRPSGADGVLWDSQQSLGAQDPKQAPLIKKWTQSPLVTTYLHR